MIRSFAGDDALRAGIMFASGWTASRSRRRKKGQRQGERQMVDGRRIRLP